jgi:hypothetical protein
MPDPIEQQGDETEETIHISGHSDITGPDSDSSLVH